MVEGNPRIENEIRQAASSIVEANPSIDPKELREQVAVQLSSTFEVDPSKFAGYTAARQDADNLGITPQEMAKGYGPKSKNLMMVEDTLGAVPLGSDPSSTEFAGMVPEDDAMQMDLERQKAAYKMAMDQGPEAQTEFAQALSANPGYSQEFKDAVFQSVDVGEPEVEVEVGDEIDEDIGPEPESDSIPVPGRKPSLEAGATGAPDGLDAVTEGMERDPDKAFGEAFNKIMSKEESTKTIADYKKDFMDEMPKYQGMSEEEKGYALMEAGLRVAAGESPFAVTNVATGLQGLGATFAKDKKAKRAWDRQVELSAAKYGLEQVAKDTAQDRADRRNRITMYDMTDPKNPKAVSIGMDQIIANDGKLPDNLVGKNIMSAKIKAANDAATRLRRILTDNAKTFRIGANEAELLRKRIEKARTSFVSGENGVQLLAQTKLKVVKGDIAGFGNAGRELLRRGFALAKIDLGKKYTNISSARADVRRAFQALIPESLGSTQTANSISDRDVRFLADAFVNSGFLADGIFSFATIDATALGKQLDGAIQVFRDGQKKGLADFDSVINRINDAEQSIRATQAAGIPVTAGPFGKRYFATQIDEVTPFAQRVRDRLSGKPVAPTYRYELQDGVYRRVPVRN